MRGWHLNRDCISCPLNSSLAAFFFCLLMVYFNLYRVTDILWNSPPSAFQISQNSLIPWAWIIDRQWQNPFRVWVMLQFSCVALKAQISSVGFCWLSALFLNCCNCPEETRKNKYCGRMDCIHVFIDRWCLYPVMFPAFDVVQLVSK